MFGGYEHAGNALVGLFRQLKWQVMSLLYHNHDKASGLGVSDCAFLSGAIQSMFNQSYPEEFDEVVTTRREYHRILEKLQEKSRSEFVSYCTLVADNWLPRLFSFIWSAVSTKIFDFPNISTIIFSCNFMRQPTNDQGNYAGRR